jgi:hypothetical protein
METDIETAEVIRTHWTDAKTMTDRELLEAMYVNSCDAKALANEVFSKLDGFFNDMKDNPMLGMLFGGKSKR